MLKTVKTSETDLKYFEMFETIVANSAVQAMYAKVAACAPPLCCDEVLV